MPYLGSCKWSLDLKHTEPERRGDALGGLKTGGMMALSALAIIVFVFVTLGQTRDNMLVREAQANAIRWASFFKAQIPDLGAAFTERHLSEQQVELISEGMLVGEIFRFKLFDAEGRVFYISDTGEFGISSEAEPGAIVVLENNTPVVDLLDGSDRPDRPIRYAEAYVPFMDDHGEAIGVIEVYVDQTSTYGTISAGFTRIRIGLPLLCAVVYLIPAISLIFARRQQRKGEASLEAVRYDALTGVLDRRHFEADAIAVLTRAKEQKVDVGFIFIDLDHFKEINDKIGHLGGDAYLQFITNTLVSNIGKQAIIGRYGGDEFVIALVDIEEDGLGLLAESLCRAVRRPFVFRGHTMTGSLSIGWFVAPPGTRLKQALDSADKALYLAKARGRDRATGYTPETSQDRNDAA